MAHVRPMAGLLLHLTLIACCVGSRPTPPSDGLRTPPSDDLRWNPPSDGLRWNPPLEDAIGMDGRTTCAVTLEYCLAGAGCSVLDEIDPGMRVARTLVSRDTQDAVVWYVGPDFGSSFRFYDLVQRLPGPSCSPLNHVVILLGAPVLRWVVDGGVLLSWRAGTSVAEAVVIDRRCRIRLEISAPALEASPDGRHLVTFPGIGTPLAAPFVVNLFDLSTGRLLQTQRVRQGNFVTSVRWLAGGVELQLRGLSGEETALAISFEESKGMEHETP